MIKTKNSHPLAGELLNVFYIFALINVFIVSKAMPVGHSIQAQAIQAQIRTFSETDKIGNRIDLSTLPKPYDYLLTQPLMTQGLANYYARTPIIQTISASRDRQKNTYHRFIAMLVDSNKDRNNAQFAQVKNEAVVVELAFITMNFKALPQAVIADVLNTNIPFGKLLSSHGLQVTTRNRSYFTVGCNESFALLMHCRVNARLYGRTNTLVSATHKKWLARVVEILPSMDAAAINAKA